MCGIAGVLQYAGQGGVSQDILKSMSDVILHRGPDDDGQWVSDDYRCGLSFRRLAIIDLSSAGHQPMQTPDSRFTIVFNGEIYNHQILRNELLAKGYQYHSRTDTESILYGYKELSEDVLDKLIGMWAIAIWDDHKKELFCARDRIGVKPFYYYHANGVFVFGSEIKSILRHPMVRTGMNLEELPNYMAFSMSSETQTLFSDIRKLQAGSWMKINSRGEVTTKRYWSPMQRNQPYSTLNEKETELEIMRLLRQAVKDRMMSDVPFGVFLSGGIDSSVNVALMSELMDRPVDTFTVGFKELEKYNELQYARQISTLFSTNHHEILIDSALALDNLETMVWHEDEPNGDPVCIPLYFLSQLTRQSGTTVIQVGEGSDEQFVGYPWMLRELRFQETWWKRYKALPTWMGKGIYSAVKPFFQATGNYLALDYVRRSAFDSEQYWGGGMDIAPTLMELLLDRKHHSNIRESIVLPARIHAEFKSMDKNDDFIKQMAYYEFAHRLPELLLMRVDKLTMAHSLEARVPFLDSRLVEFTFTIPPSLKVPDRYTTKILLKRAVESILPHDIIYRKKQGFAAPVSEWFKNQWYSYAKNEILSSVLVKENILSEFGVNHIFYLHKTGKKNMGKTIYSLLNLCLWHKKFF
jgi:asparagine synthase (glutamine-hydrolysing)